MTKSIRFLGFVPLCFFLTHWIYHASVGRAENILWLCNLNNLLLAAGLLFGIPLLIRIAAIWLIPGFPLWALDSYILNDWPPTSILAHVGALVFALLVLPKVGMNRHAWIPALLYAFAVQQICRWTTPPELNVNVAFTIFSGWERILPQYWQFWIFILLQAVIGLFLISLFLSRMYPVPSAELKETPA